jgi:hypothetical protein
MAKIGPGYADEGRVPRLQIGGAHVVRGNKALRDHIRRHVQAQHQIQEAGTLPHQKRLHFWVDLKIQLQAPVVLARESVDRGLDYLNVFESWILQTIQKR